MWRRLCGQDAGSMLAGTPSVLFDAVAVILSDEGAKALSMERAAINFVSDAFGPLKAISVDKGGQALLKTANIGKEVGVTDANGKDAFIACIAPSTSVDGYDTFLTQRARVSPIGGKNEIYSYFRSRNSRIKCCP